MERAGGLQPGAGFGMDTRGDYYYADPGNQTTSATQNMNYTPSYTVASSAPRTTMYGGDALKAMLSAQKGTS